MNIIPFENTALPAHLRTPEALAANADLTAHAGGGFPVISIKGKTFAVVRDGERKIIPNPKDPESPATHIDMVLVKANKATSKVFYLKGYTEGAEAAKPDCFSNDGIRPDESSEYKQNSVCATCKHNQWGSKVSTDGQGGKGKACQDAVRMAVAAPMQLNDPFLIRVPPASIRALGELGSMLAKRGVSYQAVITRIAFVVESPTPQLTFKPLGFLDAESYAKVQEVAGSDIVRSILGNVGVPSSEPVEKPAAEPVISPERTVSATEVVQAVQSATKPKAKKEEPKPVEAKPADLGAFSLDLSNLSFDD